jgi:hypothetical protein
MVCIGMHIQMGITEYYGGFLHDADAYGIHNVNAHENMVIQ